MRVTGVHQYEVMEVPDLAVALGYSHKLGSGGDNPSDAHNLGFGSDSFWFKLFLPCLSLPQTTAVSDLHLHACMA
jgi:hypothetical protein